MDRAVIFIIEVKVNVEFQWNPETNRVEKVLAVQVPSAADIEACMQREYRELNEI
jgi:hypothetical protein